MDGVVVVAAWSGALHWSRSLSSRFDRLHAKGDRMNLAALLFALQNVASHSVLEAAKDDESPPMTLLETTAERIVMAQGRSQSLLIALFVRPQLDVGIAQSLVRRIAHYYDDTQSTKAQLAAALQQHGRLLRDACEHAIQDEVDACLQSYVASLNARQIAKSSPVRFVMLYCEPYNGEEADEDEVHGDEMPNSPTEPLKKSLLVPPRLTTGTSDPPQRLHKLNVSTRSILPQLKAPGRHKGKKNAVMNLDESKRFQRCVLAPSAASNNDPLSTLVRHSQFPLALVNTLRQMMQLLPPSSKGSVHDGTWRNFPLPLSLLAATSVSRVAVNLRFWHRNGCFVVHLDEPCASDKVLATNLLDRIEPLAQCAVRLQR